MLNIVEKNPKVHNAVGGKYIQSKSHLYAHQIKKKTTASISDTQSEGGLED